jgi:anti-sigma factor RsiW
MPTYDTHPNLGHPEVAGWVLGSLDPPDAEAFGEHLACCSQCQDAEAEFEAVARAFRYPVPVAEPPPELEAKVLASVQHAVLTTQPDRTPAVAGIQRPVLGDRRDEGTPEPPATPAKAPPARSARWHRHWNARLLSLATAAAAVIAGAIFSGTQLFSSAAPARRLRCPMRHDSQRKRHGR